VIDYSKRIDGLSEDTSYELRAHVRHNGTEKYGAIRTFKTKEVIPVIPPPPPVVYDIILRVMPPVVVQDEPFSLLFDVWRVSGVGVHDVYFEYWFVGPYGRTWLRTSFTQAISAKVIEERIEPIGWPVGDWEAFAKITWPGGTAETSVRFEIREKTVAEVVAEEIPWLVIVSGVLALVVLSMAVIRIVKRYRRS